MENKEEIKEQRDSILLALKESGLKLSEVIYDNMSEDIGLHTTVFLKIELKEAVENDEFEIARLIKNEIIEREKNKK